MKTVLKYKKYLIIAILLLLVVAGYYLYKHKSQKPLYEPATIESTQVKQTVSASGIVTTINDVNLSFPAVAKLTNINVEKAQKVIKGDLLAQIDSYSSYQNAQSAKDARDITLRDLEIYEENYSTNPNAVGGMDEYNMNIRRLKELVSKAEATYQSYIGTLSNSYLYAPFDGTVIDVTAEVGEVVTAGTPVIKLADLDNLVFEISLDQEDFAKVKKDQKVAITLDAYPNQEISGIVTELPLYVLPNTTEFIVKITIEQNEETPILLGMEGDVEITIDQTDQPVQAVLFDSIFEENGSYYVYVLENNTLQQLPVEIGLEGDLYTQVITDLSNYEVVVPVEE